MRNIFIIDENGDHWTYWKDDNGWHKHFQPKDRTKERGPDQDVTDEDEIKKLEEYKKKAEDAWNETYGDKSGNNQKGSPQGGEGSGGGGGGGGGEAKSC